MAQPTTPRVFVSAVSSDLRSARKVINEALTRIECLPVEESVFGTEYGAIREMLRRKIASCQAVLHLVGRDYGGEPELQTLPAGQPRRSWTQIEYDLAKELGKKLYIIVCDDAFPFDSVATLEADEKLALQNAHRSAVLSDAHLWHSVPNMGDLRQQVENLKLPLDDVRDELRRQQFRQRLQTGLAAAAVVIVLIGVFYGLSQLGKKVDDTSGQVAKVGKDVGEVQHGVASVAEGVKKVDSKIDVAQQETVRQLSDPEALAAAIRKQIEATAEDKIAALTDQPGRGAKIAEIENDRDVALGRVDDLIALIQEGLEEGASPVFEQATEILEKEGIDAALAYLESRRPSTLETARRHAERAEAEKEQRNRTLQALVLEAELRETKFDWPAALELREQVANLAPDWISARNNLGFLLFQLARFDESEPHLRAVLALATNAEEEAGGLNNVALLLQRTNRLAEAEPLMRRALSISERFYGADDPSVAGCLNNLATLLASTNRLATAEPLMRRALSISERFYGADDPNVAGCLNNLASLLLQTNRLAEGEPLLRRAVAIDEQSLGPQHPDVARGLQNLAWFLHRTSRQQEAEALMLRALAIVEQSYGTDHPAVAAHLKHLISFVKDEKRLAEVEHLMRRALAIEEQCYGTDHPNVAACLDNLALLLQDTSRQAEAEHLMRQALAINEKSYGADHLNVVDTLNKLALLLQITNRRNEAEPLMRRGVAILWMFGQASGHEHPYMQAMLENYGRLLAAMEIPADEIKRRKEAAMETPRPLSPIAPEVDRLLGPAKPVADVLAELDRHYEVKSKPDVYSLPSEHAIAPYLVELLKPNADFLWISGVAAWGNGYYADAVVLYEESLKRHSGNPEKTPPLRMNIATALQALGDVQQARAEWQRLLSKSGMDAESPVFSEVWVRQQLALCEWQLGDRAAAQREAEESLQALARAAEEEPVPESFMEQARQLLADIKENKSPEPLPQVDVDAELRKARERFQAREDLATLPLNQSVAGLLDQMLGPAQSTQEVFDMLDRQYREQGKPAVWFLPLDEPISPHLDELLGPSPTDSKE